MKSGGSLGRAGWICAGFTLFSALVSAGCSLHSLHISGGHEYALYAASRSIALPLTVLYTMARRSHGGIATLAIVMILLQFFDGIIGLRLHDPSRTYGPLAFAAINLGLLLWMNRAAVTQDSESLL